MSDNFSDRLAELPVNLANHLEITIIALAVGIIVSLPLAVLLVRRPRLRYPVITVVGVIQTIPSLALLALMVPLLVITDGFGLGISAFGFYPAVIALTLYSVLPILRNTVTGILGVDPALVEAARGVGMAPRQVLFQVELPLAAPVIIAGIRTATVWTVGIATLATPAGQTCLGNYIFAGLQTRNWLMLTFGVVSAAVLAIVLDLLIGGLEAASSRRSKSLAWLCGGLLGAVAVLGVLSPSIARSLKPAPRTPVAAERDQGDADTVVRKVRIGAKTFTEQYILAELVSEALGEEGIETSVSDSLGSTIVFDALANGDVDVYIDYSGTIWANHMKREDVPPAWRVLTETEAWLARRHGIRSLGSLGFENAYAMTMRREQAEALGIQTLDDLAQHAPSLRLGTDYEFLGRPEWQALRDAYGLSFAGKASYDSTLMYEAVASGECDVISAFSSDGRIAAYDLVVLDDTRGVIPPYDAMLLLGPRVADDEAVLKALSPFVDTISVEEMRAANYLVDRERDKQTVRQAAVWLRRHTDTL